MLYSPPEGQEQYEQLVRARSAVPGRAGSAGAAARAAAQVDFSGEWAPRFHEDQPERVPGPELGDYLGLPINEAARLRADSWDASMQTLPEWQCRPHSADYIWRGPSPLTIRKEENPLTREITAFHAEWLRSIDNPIYLDGRQHPPDDALHSWGGFATGKWEGDMLTVTVTHLKEGYIRRNGMPRSDQATVTEHWMRHGDFLTVVTIVNDPVYLTEPFIRTTDYELDLHQHVPPYPCEMVHGNRAAEGRDAASSVRHQQRPQGILRAIRDSVRGDARRRRDDLSRLSKEAEAVDGTDADGEVPGSRSIDAARVRSLLAAMRV